MIADRQQQILQRLNQAGKVLATELAEELGVSEDTIRRDLNKMGQLNLLRRVHGGALPLQLDVPDYADRLEKKDPKKQKRANQAVSLLKPGQTIFINSGETCRYLALAIPKEMPLTIVTACPLVACELVHHHKAEVILLGGVLFKPALRCAGAIALDMVRRIRADICFMGICALHPEHGITAKYIEEAAMMRAMIEQSDQTIAMGGSDRLGLISNHEITPLKQLDALITDKDADPTMLKLIKAKNMAIILV
ncbi:DeoR/GlpR family DNA-binding transcription regulator [Thalassotalea marina]|uniref:DeoR family transcriptional regulator n=1 Tax=Thalassotalea marina TaxID=1673741 RepID=A0A919BCD3_9GAMM|nr:DeoR/GlpR family DNA-binding transcription regulator [Thalassotalea marina]GHF79329.1 DeoR family transcriptional regulator [Thalassotalea marina]